MGDEPESFIMHDLKGFTDLPKAQASIIFPETLPVARAVLEGRKLIIGENFYENLYVILVVDNKTGKQTHVMRSYDDFAKLDQGLRAPRREVDLPSGGEMPVAFVPDLPELSSPGGADDRLTEDLQSYLDVILKQVTSLEQVPLLTGLAFTAELRQRWNNAQETAATPAPAADKLGPPEQDSKGSTMALESKAMAVAASVREDSTMAPASTAMAVAASEREELKAGDEVIEPLTGCIGTLLEDDESDLPYKVQFADEETRMPEQVWFKKGAVVKHRGVDVFAKGARVLIFGLVNKPRYNDKEAQVCVELPDGQYQVRLQGRKGDKLKRIRAENLRRLELDET